MNESSNLKDYLKSVSLFFSSLEEPYNPGKNEIDVFLHILSHVNDFRLKGKVLMSIYK